MFTTRAYQTLCLKIDQKPVAARMRIDETAHSALLSGPVSLSLSLSAGQPQAESITLLQKYSSLGAQSTGFQMFG